MAQAGPSNPPKSRKLAKQKGPHTSKLRKTTEAQVIEALEQTVARFVRFSSLEDHLKHSFIEDDASFIGRFY